VTGWRTGCRRRGSTGSTSYRPGASARRSTSTCWPAC
jgi:hypothetical protein